MLHELFIAHKILYYRLEKDADMKASAALIQPIHNEFKNVFTGIGNFKGAFLLQIKEWVKPY